MHFAVLGPIDVRSAAGIELDLGGPKQRAVLALLLVSANRVVETGRLVEELWPDGGALSGRKTVQAYVARIRRVFAAHDAADALQGRAGGYVLEIDPLELDTTRFERDVSAARALVGSDPERAATQAQACLSLWRGRPFEDAFATPALETEAARLEELRLLAVETRLEADLALGHHADVVAELESLIRADVPRERMWALLMVALYRCGRQAEALARYRELHEILDERLGVEPGPEVRDIERQILTHDPALDVPREPAASAEIRAKPGRRLASSLPRRRWRSGRHWRPSRFFVRPRAERFSR